MRKLITPSPRSSGLTQLTSPAGCAGPLSAILDVTGAAGQLDGWAAHLVTPSGDVSGRRGTRGRRKERRGQEHPALPAHIAIVIAPHPLLQTLAVFSRWHVGIVIGPLTVFDRFFRTILRRHVYCFYKSCLDFHLLKRLIGSGSGHDNCSLNPEYTTMPVHMGDVFLAGDFRFNDLVLWLRQFPL